jgi:hypothetical protein
MSAETGFIGRERGRAPEWSVSRGLKQYATYLALLVRFCSPLNDPTNLNQVQWRGLQLPTEALDPYQRSVDLDL